MKKFLCLFLGLAACALFNDSSAQLIDKIKNKVKQRADQKVDQSIDKGLDKVEESAKNKTKTEEGEVTEKTEDGETKIKTESKNPASLRSYSKYDFVPGDKIIYSDDFSTDAIGEFPVKWNTNGSGEVVTIDGVPGKWLKLNESTKYETGYKNKLPENYTVEFDLIADFKEDQTVPYINVQLEADKLENEANGQLAEVKIAPNGGINVEESHDGIYYESRNGKSYTILEGKKQLFNTFNKYNHTNTPVHIALWVQKQRIRVWVNQDKMYDLPRGMAELMNLNQLSFETTSYGGPASNYNYFISNVKIAVANPDTRSKLITEGKFVTTGITFDVNSDKIKPTSYGALKEIATTLKETPDVRVKIVGHTDSDGDDSKNLDLSKKRAASVRIALTTEFGIDGSRFETDGMGETKPLADNKTSEGKAQNRRVEFVKL